MGKHMRSVITDKMQPYWTYLTRAWGVFPMAALALHPACFQLRCSCDRSFHGPWRTRLFWYVLKWGTYGKHFPM